MCALSSHVFWTPVYSFRYMWAHQPGSQRRKANTQDFLFYFLPFSNLHLPPAMFAFSFYCERGSAAPFPRRLSFFCHTLNLSPSAGRVRGLKGSTHLSPGTRLAFWSRGLGQHSRTASPLDKHSVNYVVYSRFHAFHGGNRTLRRKSLTHWESNPRFSSPKGNGGTPTRPG